MSMKAINWALKVQCSSTQKLVLIVLANHANDEGYCFPSNDLLVRATCLTDRAIRAAKLALIESGLIEKTPDYCRNAMRVLVDSEPEPHSAKPEPRSVSGEEPRSGKAEPRSAETEPHSAPIYNNHHITTNNHHDQKPRRRDQKPERDNSRIIEPDRFEEFWKTYPRKVAKQAARLAWKSAIKIAPPEQILASLRRFKFSNDPQYQPHPRTWLHQHRWEDNAPGPVLSRQEITAKTQYENALKDWLMKRSFGEKTGPKPEISDFLGDRRVAA